MKPTTWLALPLGLALLACTESEPATGPEPDPATVQRAESLVPADAKLAAIYNRSCRACHALPGLQAPLSGHAAAWKSRMRERGMPELVRAVRQGRGTMPPMGYCADCSDDDFRALITFMSREPTP